MRKIVEESESSDEEVDEDIDLEFDDDQQW